MIGSTAEPSLTLELFGYHSAWERATQVALSPINGAAIEIVVSGSDGEISRRTLSSERGEYRCEEGRVIVKDQRWIAADVVAGRESVEIELSSANSHLVAHVRERSAGVLFLVIPVFGTTSSWYRFERLR